MKRIYCDHAATTPLDKAVLEMMLPYFSDSFGNASSVHNYGQDAALAVDQARQGVAEFFNCQSSEVIFSSGATESNNLAILGLVRALKLDTKAHVITLAIEHDSVLEPCQFLGSNNEIELSYAELDKQTHQVNLDSLYNQIKAETVLISIGYVNSELGLIQSIKEIGALVAKVNYQRKKAWEAISSGQRPATFQKLYFHCDATQAVNFLNCDLQDLNVDLMSVSAHKIYGPKGVGVLIVREGVPMSPLIRGGHHEKNWRSGTVNVPGVVGLAQALKLVKLEQIENNKKISDLRNYLAQEIVAKIPEVVVHTEIKMAVPSHLFISFLDVSGEALLMALDMQVGVAVSTGSACASNQGANSKVLTALGLPVEMADSAIRFSLGKNNTRAEIDLIVKSLVGIVERFRSR